MARLHVLSDLHIEFGPFVPPGVDADLTILAGDTYTKTRLWPGEDIRSVFGRPVVMVAGNHEFYDAKVDTEIPKLKAVSEARGVSFLENDEVVIAGVRILGCTLWTDFRFFAGDDLDQVKQDANRCVGVRNGPGLNDFRKIRVAAGAYRSLRPKDTAKIHMASVRWLRDRLAEPFAGPTVVVTHHAPATQCVPEDRLKDRITCAYASRLEGMIEELQPDAWVWGHIHDAVPEFRIGRTRMISNPRGYVPMDTNKNFRPDLVIEV